MSSERGTKHDGGNLHSNDRNYALRMRLLDQAHRDAVWRLKGGHAAAAVLWELREAYRLAEVARPIDTYTRGGK